MEAFRVLSSFYIKEKDQLLVSVEGRDPRFKSGAAIRDIFGRVYKIKALVEIGGHISGAPCPVHKLHNRRRKGHRANDTICLKQNKAGRGVCISRAQLALFTSLTIEGARDIGRMIQFA